MAEENLDSKLTEAHLLLLQRLSGKAAAAVPVSPESTPQERGGSWQRELRKKFRSMFPDAPLEQPPNAVSGVRG